MTVDETGVDETVVDETGVDELGINLPEENSTTVHDLTVPSVSSLSSSVMVHSHFHWRGVISLNMNLIWHVCKFETSYLFVQFKFSSTSKQTGIHTHAFCNAVRLAQARPDH